MMIKQILKRVGISYLYGKFIKTIDSLFCSRVECSIGDIVLQRDVPSNNQLLLTSRLLDVEKFFEEKDKTFPYQNAISYKKYGANHKEQRGNMHFRDLIESYRKNGYKPDSYITCDKDLFLMDGNHRMGLHIYEKIEKVNVRIVKRKVNFEYSGDWYYSVGLPSDMMEQIYKKYQEIQQWLINSGNTFSLLIENINDKILNIKIDIYHLVNVLHIYDIDDNSLFVQFSLQQPDYVVKGGELISRRTCFIEKVLQARFPNSKIQISKNCLEGKRNYESIVKRR